MGPPFFNIILNTEVEPAFSPIDFGADLKLWVNGRTQTGKTKSDVWSSTLDSFLSNDASAHSFTWSASAANKSFQGGGEGSAIYTRISNNNAYTNAEKTPYRFLHDDTSSEFWFRIRIIEWPQAGASFLVMFRNNGATSAQVGMSTFMENSATNPRAIRYNQTDGSGTVVINSTTSNVVPATGYVTGRVTKVPTSGGNVRVTIYINGTQVAQVTSTNPVDSGDPTSNLSVLSMPSTAKVQTQDIIAINRALTAGEVVSLTNYLETQVVESEDAYVGAGGGQSNMVGGASSPSAPLQSAQDFYICSGGTLATSGALVGKLLFGSNNQGASATQFGPELSFGYNFQTDYARKGFLMKYSVGGTSMYADWNLDAVNSLGVDLIVSFINVCIEIKYRLNRTPKVLFFLWSQGEADSQIENPNSGGGSAVVKAAYKTPFQALYKRLIDDLNTAGFDTSGCIMIAVTRGLGLPTYPWEPEINAAITEVAQDILTLEPTLVDKCIPGVIVSMVGQPTYDGTHFNNVGQEYCGQAMFSEVVFP